MLHARHLRTGDCEKEGTSQSSTVASEQCLKNIQTPVPRGELKPTSATSQSWLGKTCHLHSAKFSSKNIQREKNRKASEDLHNSSVQYNLCFRWENYLRLGNTHLISQMWGMSTGVDAFRLPSSKNGKHLAVKDRYASNGSWKAEVGRRWVWGLPQPHSEHIDYKRHIFRNRKFWKSVKNKNTPWKWNKIYRNLFGVLRK